MKFFDTKGREHNIDIRPSKWPQRPAISSKGQFQSEVGEVIRGLLPHELILEEFPCVGEDLFMDFFLPRRLLAVEVQGQQHYKFTKFFHKDRAAFLAQQQRDQRKSLWCDANKIKLIIIPWTSTPEQTLTLISEAL